MKLWFYDMLLDARKNLCRAVKSDSLPIEEAFKIYTDIMLKTIDAAVAKDPKTTGEITVKIKADTKEFDKAMRRLEKQIGGLSLCELCGRSMWEVTRVEDFPDRHYFCHSCRRTFVSTPEVEELEKTMEKICEKIRRQQQGDRGRNKLC